MANHVGPPMEHGLRRLAGALLGLGALLAVLAAAGMAHQTGIDRMAANALSGVSRPRAVLTQKHEMPAGFYCLNDTLIYAPRGLVVYGTVPASLSPCSPSANPLAGAEGGKNYLIETQGGWVWNPRMGEKRR